MSLRHQPRSRTLSLPWNNDDRMIDEMEREDNNPITSRDREWS